MPEEQTRFLTDDEVHVLILSLGRGQETFTQDDVARVLNWAQEARLDAAMLSLVLSGEIVVSVTESGEVAFAPQEVQP